MMNEKIQEPKHYPDRRKFLKTGLLLVSGLAFSLIAKGEVMPSTAPLTQGPHDASKVFADSQWVREAIRMLWSEKKRSGVTPLLRLEPHFRKNLQLYMKHEAKSVTGSLKHRVAWGLIMGAIVNGAIGPETHLYEATSGNTAIGEAYFASILGLTFTAVMRPGLSGSKIQAVRQYGGNVAIAPSGMASMAHLEQLLAGNPNGYNLNQFANTEKVLDTFDADPDKSMNIAAEVFRQMQLEPCPCPEWFIAGAGSGGTATSIARYIRKWADLNGRDCHSKLAVVDPEISVIYDWYLTGDTSLKISSGSRIEGIGSSGPVIFGRTLSLLREGVSHMIKVPDSASIAGMQFLSELLGSKVGPSTGTNFYGALRLMDRMNKEGRGGSLVSIICDDGNMYLDTYYNPEWITKSGMNPQPWKAALEKFWETGSWVMPDTASS
ncbi:MAG: PLP-dependent cysteine synthase family protein [Syntrophobacteraceae bacterium]